MFLNARGRHDPDIFANADFNSIHLGHVSQAVMPAYISGYTMLLIGQKSPSKYGRLISWEDDGDAFSMMSSGIGIQPGEGLLIMEIQQRKLGFLRSCAEIILQDLPLHDAAIPTQPPPPGFRADSRDRFNDSEWPSLTKAILEAPYRVPDQLDIDRLQTFVSAKRDEAEDHVEVLSFMSPIPLIRYLSRLQDLMAGGWNVLMVGPGLAFPMHSLQCAVRYRYRSKLLFRLLLECLIIPHTCNAW